MHIQDPELAPFLAFAIFLFGLAFGSFLNVVIYRLPRHKSVVAPASACPGCGSGIAPYDNIPVLSWLLLRGRCRKCQMHISARYLLVEVLNALLFVGIFLRFGPTLATIKFCVFSFLLLGLIFIDAEHKLLPDRLTLPGLALGLIFSFFVRVPHFVTLFLPAGLFSALPPHVAGRLLSFGEASVAAGISALLLFVVGEVYFRIRKVEGLGFGDVKLMAMVGAFLGIKLSLFVIFAGSFLGSLFGFAVILYIWRKRAQRWRELRKLGRPRQGEGRGGRCQSHINDSRYHSAFFWVAWQSLRSSSATRLIRWYWRLFL